MGSMAQKSQREVEQKSDILSRTLDIVNQQLGLRGGDEYTLLSTADEYDMEEIQSELQIEFDIDISLANVNKCQSVGDLVKLVKEKTQ